MSAKREYFCTSWNGDVLAVWADGTGAGFQTTAGHTAFLNTEQIENLIDYLEAALGGESRKSAQRLWRDVEI